MSMTLNIIEPNDYFINNNPIVIASRSTFVSIYMGGTADKTEKFLHQQLGKIVFIDEAYSLYNGPHDSYGAEALSSINKFMSEHENEIVIIFAGYEKELKNTIFKIQPGLARRCIWSFKFDDYNGEELYDIFKLKANDEQQIDPQDEYKIKQFFIKYEKEFTGNGGDINKLLFYIMLNKDLHHHVIKYKDVKNGVKELLCNHIHSDDTNKKSVLDDFKKYFDQ
jgi:hypothetical protein